MNCRNTFFKWRMTRYSLSFLLVFKCFKNSQSCPQSHDFRVSGIDWPFNGTRKSLRIIGKLEFSIHLWWQNRCLDRRRVYFLNQLSAGYYSYSNDALQQCRGPSYEEFQASVSVSMEHTNKSTWEVEWKWKDIHTNGRFHWDSEQRSR